MMGRVGRCATIGLAALAAVAVWAETPRQRRRLCKLQCGPTIDRCVAGGRRRSRCRAQTLRRCRRHGLTACTTTTTTVPTTTTLPGVSVLQHHRNATRDGVYVDPAFTRAAAAALHVDTGFNATTQGQTYAQPLYFDGAPTNEPDRVFVATEENWVYALDAITGATVASTQLAPSITLAQLGTCGNIDPMGVTGTPVIDYASRTLFVGAMTTPDGGQTAHHVVYGLSIDDLSMRPGWPVDVTAALAARGMTFESDVQGQRGALLVVGGTLYVPYGGLAGDCGSYHGWVVSFPLAAPSAVQAWSTAAVGGGAWAPGGLASDGVFVYAATGNTFGANVWSGGEAIVRLGPGPTFTGAPADYFAPTDWKALDAGDVDIGGSGPVLFDLPGASPAALVVSLGKNGKAYLLDRGYLGGITDGVAHALVASNEIINAAAAYTTPTATYVVFKGNGTSCPGAGGDLTALAIGAGAPPTISTAWCASQDGTGSPMVTTLDGHAGAIVWSVGAESGEQLHGFDGDTGAELVAVDTGMSVARFSTPIAAKGRLFVAGDSTVRAFTTR
ncbi:MAG TPA: hypothetical protein VKW76_08355 [Candidatus Binatia bacterium]|nr:hypothetical protein [Candidatus Binatia bacterium]